MVLEDLFAIHREVMGTTQTQTRRYPYTSINWNAHAVCILGDRGVGKTTLMCQRLIEEYKSVERGLYISADNIHVISQGLFNIAKLYFSYGGEALFIDEIHKYPNWSLELKNIIDTYKKCKIVFSASSSLDLRKSKADLSRRVVYYPLLGLSFREYALLSEHQELPLLTLEDILQNHVQIAEELHSKKVLKNFKSYLSHGYYPFFLEGTEDYLSKVNNIIEKVLYEDISVVFGLKQTTIPVLKKLLWMVATTDGLTPNIDNVSSAIGVSREMIYNCFEFLAQSGLIMNVAVAGGTKKVMRKPGKVYLNNTNLLYAINGGFKTEVSLGAVRECFFLNQLYPMHRVNLHSFGDFTIDDEIVVEIGGAKKNYKQIKDLPNSYLVVDDLEVGFRNKIPLYIFGLLY